MYSVVKRGQVYQPAISGNGKVVAWRDLPQPGVSEIGIQREGEEPTLLTDDGLAVKMPALNYDGSVVVFERHGGKDWDWDIARLEVGQSDPEIIIDTDGMSTDFDLSSDGNTVVTDYWPRSLPRIRNVTQWSKGQGTKPLSPEGISSGLPQISGDGNRVFYLRLPNTPRQPNEVWMQEADGSEKPVLYETDQRPKAIQKQSFDTNHDGSILAWTQKEGTAPAQVWTWDLKNGNKEKLDEAYLAGQVDISEDGSTVTWVSRDFNDQGELVSELHWKRGAEDKVVASDVVGLNTFPSLSDDGNTLVWMWQNPKINFDHEIRKVVMGES
jgi:Tol biopolymer transport system component